MDEHLLALADTPDSRKPSAEELRELAAHKREIAQVESQIDELRKLQRQANRANNFKGGKGKNKKPQPPRPQVNGEAMRTQIKELQDKLDKLEAERTPVANLAMGVLDAPKATNCQVLVRGELKDKGPEVPRGVLTVLKTAQASHINDGRHSGRFALAQWIANKSNPLTARVMVNRVWAHLFGQGLVESVDNFGALGEQPSHAELLDTLAVQFMEEGWSLKRLIRTIVLSHAYQLSSEHNDKNYAQDPANRLVWRMERRRLDAEEIRDAMLMASGQLDLNRPDGSPVMEFDNGVIRGRQLQEVRKQAKVRSIYLPVIRGNLPDMLQVFDAADPSLIVGKRDVTTVPTQALFMMNNPFVLEQSNEMAKRILAEKDRDQATRIELAFRYALSRLATPPERRGWRNT